ncbi:MULTISPECIES: ABC transporter permease [Chelatococcus]|uniref:ABC-type dipeptide/oligopeptide/nickel transport system permease component n=1 Tax=Chelatococcus caeni TaxID=1348468 RepID=A0A840C1A0_9HYPH|nr:MULTISPECIES: ABC transporter permease [unclassified Chelatococcus]MBB4018583.1 ABC-type dipeptide/oligopeptide/nickel transport system permease component [Chelatococcus caeni]
MLEYALARLLRMVVTMLVIVTGVFFATRLSGNAVDFIGGEGLSAADRATLVAYYGLDASWLEQYWRYLRALAEGNFGISLVERRPVSTIALERVGPSLQLLVGAVLLTLAVAVPAGTLAAVYRKSWAGSMIMGAAFLGYAIPNFVLAVLLILTLSFWLGWLPSSGNGSLAHFVMPVVALSAFYIASLTRFTRNAMLDVLSQDYLRTARAKGLAEPRVIFKHALRNALITILSVLGLQIAGLAAAGNVVIETIFAWRGIGEMLVSAALRRDYPVLQFGVIAVALAVILINTLVDLAYGAADPRVRLARS